MSLMHIGFFSHTLGMCTSCDVVLPQRRADHRIAGEKFPVLWLLHGAGDDETAWQRRSSIERYAQKYALAVVMPAAQLSRYADMVYGLKFYTYISEELPQIMRDFLPLSERREENLIAGLSMGGAGALRIGLSHPQAYSAIGCLSAGLSNYEREDPDDTSAQREEQYRLAFGQGNFSELEGASYQYAQDIVCAGTCAPRIYHVCGSQDMLLSNAHKTRDFFRAFPGNPFDYLYEEYPGVHNWEFWDAHIQNFLAYARLPKRVGFCG